MGAFTRLLPTQLVLTQLQNNGRISRAFSENGWLPLFDFAYQGLANGLDQDDLRFTCICSKS